MPHSDLGSFSGNSLNAPSGGGGVVPTEPAGEKKNEKKNKNEKKECVLTVNEK